MNLAGKSLAFISKTPATNFVKVSLPNTVSSVGAMVQAVLADGRVVNWPFVKGEGLCSDSTPIITIGAGDSQVDSVSVKFLDGESMTFSPDQMGATITVGCDRKTISGGSLV